MEPERIEVQEGRDYTLDIVQKDEAKDPWQHRAQGMRCRTCMWYVEKEGSVGRCRRHAPTMNGYPVVYETDWCGDHKLNEKA